MAARGKSRPGLVRTLEEVSQAFQCHVQTVKGWSRDGCPPKREGLWDVVAIALWKADREHSRNHDAHGNWRGPSPERRRCWYCGKHPRA